jgi:hypothetical protein
LQVVGDAMIEFDEFTFALEDKCPGLRELTFAARASILPHDHICFNIVLKRRGRGKSNAVVARTSSLRQGYKAAFRLMNTSANSVRNRTNPTQRDGNSADPSDRPRSATPGGAARLMPITAPFLSSNLAGKLLRGLAFNL